jgi:pantoate--beta-alanine ligase
MSSRNRYLNPDERAQAIVLKQTIELAQKLTGVSGISSARLKQKLSAFIETFPLARLDYLEVFDPDNLQPVKTAKKGSQLALAVFFGKTRLIDNGRL